jgi:hypothetical protein
VLEVYNGVSYELALPESVKIHDVFHFSLSRKFNKDGVWGRTNPMQLIPIQVLKHRIQKVGVHDMIKWEIERVFQNQRFCQCMKNC